MNKKFMVVALLAALSTVGYAFDSVGGNVENLNNTNHGTWNQTTIDKINSNVNSIVSKTDENFNKVQEQLNQKVNKDEVYTKTEVNNTFAKQDELDSLKTQVENNTAISTENSKLVGELKQENKTQQEQIDKNTTDIEDIKENVYTKDEVNEALNGKVDQEEFEKEKDNIYGAISGNTTQIADEIKAREEADKNLETQINKNKEEQAGIDKEQDSKITTNETNIANLQQASNNHEARITHLEDRVDRLDEKMNEGLSLMAAMNAVDFQNVEAGEMAIGAGFGHYGNAQSVAVGVAYAPIDNFNVNVKYSATAGNPESFAIGAGASYKFKVGR